MLSAVTDLGVALSGIEGSTINATSTDYGSVAKCLILQVTRSMNH